MKTSVLALTALLAFQMAISAAPRLIVSTPSLAPESQIDLVLDSPAVATNALGKTVENTWLEVQPALSGKLVWKAQNIARFIPDKPPAIGTSYTFSISKGHQHLDQSAVPAGKITTVESEPFRIVAANAPKRWNSDYSTSTSEWLIVFNDDTDPATAAPFVSFVSKAGQRVPARLTRATVASAGYFATNNRTWSARFPNTPAAEITPESPVSNIVIATPASPLPVGKNWVISAAQGLPNLTANARLVDEGVYDVGNVDPFTSTGIESYVEADQPMRILLTFNQNVAEKLPDDFLTSCLDISPRPENLAAEIDGRQIRLTGTFTTEGKYIVTIKPPLAARSGLTLAASATKEIAFEHVEPGIALPSDNQAQLATGSRSYRIQTVNLASLHIRIKKLTNVDLVRAYQGYSQYTGIGHDGNAVEPTAPLPYPMVVGETVCEKDIPLGNAIDTSKEITLLWDELLPKDLRHAALFLDVTGTPHAEAKKGRHSAQAMVQLTEIGLAWKLTAAEAFIYAFSCDTGAPLPGVKVELFGEDAKMLGVSTTGASGLVTVPRSDAVRHIRASLGDDGYLTAFDSTLSTVGLWHFPIRYSWNKSTAPVRKVMLFTDRSLYRPGETVRLKGIIRTLGGNTLALAKQSPARIVIVDPTDKEIHNAPVEVSSSGSFDVTYQLPLSTTGTHTIRFEYPEEIAAAEAAEAKENWDLQESLSESARFEMELRVEEFRRNAFEIKQEITAPAPGATTVTAGLAATYYQGQPVAAGKVTHFSRVTAENPYPERFRDFLFGNHRTDDWTYWYHYFGYKQDDEDSESGASSQVQGEAVLSADGKAALSVAIPQAEFPTTREVTLSAEVTDANNQTLTSTASTTVHPASVYVGVSRNDSLVRAGQVLPLRLVATDTEGEPFKGAVKVTATLTREVNSTVKSATDSGATTTRNDVAEETVSTSEITIDPAASAKEGTSFTVTPKSTGKHFLTLRGNDPEGRPFATVIYFNAYGTKEYPWLYEDGMRVKLVAEKKSYQPGDTARVLVLSPIEGTALVTVEREKVLRSFLVPLTADKPVIDIPLTADDAPNAFVSVLIIKGAKESARDHKEPQLRLGYCELIVENLRDRLAVNLTNTEAHRPGDDVTLTGTVTLANGSPAAGAEVTLYAEDEGTLAVMGYETPKPMDFFYKPRDLAVESGTSIDTFIPEDPDRQDFSNKGFFIGGGGDLGKLADLLRKNFDPCATWAPAIVTDASGKFTHTFKLPDTLTHYRLIAIAHHEAVRFGHVESSLLVKKDLMLEPKTVRFANEGDTFDSQVLVQNASEFSGTWEIGFSTRSGAETPSALPQGATTQTVTLEAGKSATVVFPTLAKTTGEAVLTWKATPVSLANGNLIPKLAHRLSDAVETRFQVNYPMPLLRQSKLITCNKPGAKHDLRNSIDSLLADGSGTVDLEFSRSPLVDAGASIDYLLSYPHGCVEQTSSSLIPWLSVESLSPVIPGFAKIPEAEVTAAIQAGADRLLSMMLPDGSFSYWPGGTETVPWATSYAGMVLLMASEKGANVPESAIESLKKNLLESLRGLAGEKSPSALEGHARSLLVLALAGEAQPAYHSVMTERLASLSPTARALLATAICLVDEGNEENQATARSILTSKVPFKLKSDDWMPWTADEACTLIAWIAADPTGNEATKALDKMLHDRNPYGHWRTTWVNGWSLMAMAAYAESQELTDQTTTLNFTTADGAETINLSSDQPTASRSLKLTPDLKMELVSNHNAYVRMKVAAKPKVMPQQPVAKNGLSVDRTYERINSDGSASVLTEPKVGDLIRVSLRVTLPKDNSRYLVIEDPLPAIFETVNNDFASQKAAAGIRTSENDWNVSHSELRTDRALFYLDEVWRKGTYKLSYLARCTVAGQATAPSAKVESMYDPENFALSASRVFLTK